MSKYETMLEDVLRLRRAGVSALKIARTLGIPYGSIDGVLKLAERTDHTAYYEAWLLAVSRPWRAAS